MCLTLAPAAVALALLLLKPAAPAASEPELGEQVPVAATDELRRTAIEQGLWLVSGRVVGADGMPLPGWRVVRREDEGLWTSVRTDSEGHFCLGVDSSRFAVNFDIEPPAGAGAHGMSGVSAFRFEGEREVDLGDIRVAGARR